MGEWNDKRWVTLYKRFQKAKSRNKLPPDTNLVQHTNRWFPVFYPAKPDKPLSEDAQPYKVDRDGRVFASGDYPVYRYLKELAKDDDKPDDYYEYIQDVPTGSESDRRYRHPRIKLRRRKIDERRNTLPSSDGW